MISEIRTMEKFLQEKISEDLYACETNRIITFAEDRSAKYALYSFRCHCHTNNSFDMFADIYVAYCREKSDYKFVREDCDKFKYSDISEFTENLYKLVADTQKYDEEYAKREMYDQQRIDSEFDIYCNENVKLRIGGRKAPKGGRSHLTIQAIYKYLNTNQYDEYYYDMLDALASEGYNKKFHKDFKYDVDWENREVEDIGTTKSGIDYLACWKGGDWEAPAAFFIYWDGTDIRAYEPLKGNAINTLNKSAFGNDEDLDDEYMMKEFGNVYERNNIGIDWGSCLEDFENRLEVNGDCGDSDMQWEMEKNSEY